MYNALLKEHRVQASAARRQLDSLRADALQSAERVTQHLFSDVHSGLGAVYRTQRQLAHEAEVLSAHSSRFAKTSERWVSLSQSLHTSLKELGDVSNWALTIQNDVRFIEQQLQHVVEANNARKAANKARRDAEIERRKQAAASPAASSPSVAATPSVSAAAAASSPANSFLPPDADHVAGSDEELP